MVMCFLGEEASMLTAKVVAFQSYAFAELFFEAVNFLKNDSGKCDNCRFQQWLVDLGKVLLALRPPSCKLISHDFFFS